MGLITERAWVELVKVDIEKVWKVDGTILETGRKLPYALNITGYNNVNEPSSKPHRYQTDLLISEVLGSERWIPRIVVEFKFGKVSTHDALTYSAKAATHKSIHPYLRYGIVIGAFDSKVPNRLIRHGNHFDFMMTLASPDALTSADRDQLTRVLEAEVNASRKLSSLLSEGSGVRLLHRKLEWIGGTDIIPTGSKKAAT